MDKKKQKSILIPRDGCGDTQFVSVNGKSMLIQKGVQVQVDADVAAVVENMFTVRAENAAKSGRMRLA